ncbi:MAG: Uma2 family endonuclease [Candidatus Eremiobacteraeota bacterium]|nr:Uma2 family endonuclease [Candidatus Eremiobacteraeota bacterium]
MFREAMPLDEIVTPITKPETEWVRGRALVKTSPTRDHSRIQTQLASALDEWSIGRGEVGTEWRFRIAVPGEPRRPLVPDVSFVEFAALRGLSHEDIQLPAFAPTVAVEVLSRGDLAADVASKIDVYLRGDSRLVIVVDPHERTLVAHDVASVSAFRTGDVFTHPALPDFRLDLAPFFARALDLPT